MNYTGVFPDLPAAQHALGQAVADAREGKINLVSQSHEVLWIPPMMAVQIRTLQFDPNSSTYKVGGGRVTFGRDALELLAQTARLDVLSSIRTDDGSVDHFCSFEVQVRVPLLTGGYLTAIGNKTEDLRDDSAGAKTALGNNNSKANLSSARQFIAERTATKARLRAYRQALQISGMTGQVVSKPWIVVALVPYFDASLVSQKVVDAAAARLLGIEDMMFGGDAPPRPLPAPQAPAALPRQDAPPLPDAPPPVDDVPDEPPPLDMPHPKNDAATADQIKAMGAHYKSLGAEAFQKVGAQALGVEKMPHSSAMTSDQAEAVLAGLEAAGRVDF